jgi:uncharacterized protein (DUF1786 family)
MAKYLLIDVGAGTLDLLYYDDEAALHYKAVVKSPAVRLAECIENTQGDLLIVGREMGGGRLSEVLRKRASQDRVMISRSAAATLHHDLARVEKMGLEVLSDHEAGGLARDESYPGLIFGDIDPEWVRAMVTALGAPFEFDAVGVCVQDHGVPPKGVSHLDYRHQLFVARLAAAPRPQALIYTDNAIPATMNRLSAAAADAGLLPTKRVYVMDSGMAAILGASQDPGACRKTPLLVLDIATSHTVGATVADGELAGFFEYHTHAVTPERLGGLLRGLADGTLTHAGVLAEGGHGAYIREAVGFDNIAAIVATGPKRALIREMDLFKDSDSAVSWGAPLGDNMMTGTLGLLQAIRYQEGKPEIEA